MVEGLSNYVIKLYSIILRENHYGRGIRWKLSLKVQQELIDLH